MRLLLSICLTALGVLVAVPSSPANAVESGNLSLTATADHTKAKVGTIVEYKAIVTNTGTEPILGLVVSINLPDALNARAVYCPLGDSHDTVVLCDLGDLPAGTLTEVDFFVQVGARSPNGPVSITASSSDGRLLRVDLPALKIVGSPRG